MPDRLRLDIHDESDMALRRWFYAHGPLAAIARAAGVPKSTFHSFLNGAKPVDGERYDRLLEAAALRPELPAAGERKDAFLRVMFALGMGYGDLGKSRRRELVARRCYLCWLVRESTGMSYRTIAGLCGWTKHERVRFGVRRFAARIAADATLRAEAMEMLTKVKEAMRERTGQNQG